MPRPTIPSSEISFNLTTGATSTPRAKIDSPKEKPKNLMASNFFADTAKATGAPSFALKFEPEKPQIVNLPPTNLPPPMNLNLPPANLPQSISLPPTNLPPPLNLAPTNLPPPAVNLPPVNLPPVNLPTTPLPKIETKINTFLQPNQPIQLNLHPTEPKPLDRS